MCHLATHALFQFCCLPRALARSLDRQIFVGRFLLLSLDCCVICTNGNDLCANLDGTYPHNLEHCCHSRSSSVNGKGEGMQTTILTQVSSFRLKFAQAAIPSDLLARQQSSIHPRFWSNYFKKAKLVSATMIPLTSVHLVAQVCYFSPVLPFAV